MTDFKITHVSELTFPQWQEWLVHYNALLLKRGRRIEKLEAALREIVDCVTLPAQNDFEMREIARKALEGRND